MATHSMPSIALALGKQPNKKRALRKKNPLLSLSNHAILEAAKQPLKEIHTMKRRRDEDEKMKPADRLKGRKIAVYSRKSKFTGKGDSVENQIKACHDYLRLHFPDIDDAQVIEYQDEGFSGKNTDRPQFKAMMDACKRGDIGLIICYRLDRFSRKTLDFLRISEDLEDWGVAFVSINDHFDTTTSTGKAMMTMVAAFAELERETIQERICDNLLALAETGRWLGGIPPTGYRSEEVLSHDKRKQYKLTRIPEEAELVRLIFRLFLENNSIVAVDKYLLQNNILTKNGKAFSRHTIKAILENPVYMAADEAAWGYFTGLELEIFSAREAFDGQHGMMVYNKTSQTKGRGNEFLPMEEWVIAVGAHKGIVSGADWVRVQRMLAQNKSKAYHKPKSHHALLSGLLFCGGCGAHMRPKLSQRTNENGQLVFAYLCEKKERSNGRLCSMPRPNGNTLDALVCDEVKKLSGNPEVFQERLEHYRQHMQEHRGEFADEAASFTKQIAEIDRQIENLVMAVANGDAQGYMAQQIEKLHERKAALEVRTNEIKSLTREYLLPENEVAILVEMLSAFANTFDNMSIEEKRAALRRVIQRVEYHKNDEVKIYFTGYQFEPQGEGCK